jgi:hypothetical protein
MENESDTPAPKILLPALLISLVLFGGVYLAYQSAKSRQSRIILPGGITYLGPTPTPIPLAPTSTPLNTSGVIPIPSGTKWSENKGKLYPYSFSYPSTLSLGWFPNDQYDSVTLFYGNTDANTNMFFRVDNLTALHKTAYIGKPMEYAKNWWKDYLWKNVATVTTFTNNHGLKGYRATYLDKSDKTPYDHVFFEVPGRTDLIIWISGRLFDTDTFNKLVDSVSWK